MQIVAAAEGLRIARSQHRLHPPRLDVEFENAAPIIRNEDAPVPADLQSVRPTLIFDDQRPVAVGRNPEDATEGNVDDVEMTFGIEGGTFDEAIGRLARPVGIGPFGCDLAAEFRWDSGEYLGFDQFSAAFPGTSFCWFHL